MKIVKALVKLLHIEGDDGHKESGHKDILFFEAKKRRISIEKVESID